MTKPIPENHNGFIPYLIVKNADEAISFYEKAFAGKRGLCLTLKDGSIGHAEIEFSNTRIMLSQENEEWGALSPTTTGHATTTLTLYVDDVDAVAKRVIEAGMKVKREVETHFYGDRMGTFTDPYGYDWTFGTHVKDVSAEEMQQMMKDM